MKLKKVVFPAAVIFLTAVILFAVSTGLSSLEQKNEAKKLDILLHTLLPGSQEFTEEVYTGEDVNIQKVYKAENGFVIQTCTQGYVDPITMLVGVSSKGTVTGVVIDKMAETPGLGASALNDVEFLAQFLNTSGEASVGTTVDAISGATVTSKAVTRSVNSAVAYVTGADASSGATSWGG
ncbi:MAG: FMN-binding protein [Lachnospiraceae bacterium]|nr:FMN-binding protein [Lachnospiraceae bacterium]